MFGKLYDSMYTGSMFGAGAHVFAVWGYCIANGIKGGGTLELNPRMLACTLGCSEEEVEKAIAYLCAPDQKSRNKTEEGRRLVKDGEYQYRMVNFKDYFGIRSQDERREYNRHRQRAHREKVAAQEGVQDNG